MSDRLTGDERRIIQALEGIENNTRREATALEGILALMEKPPDGVESKADAVLMQVRRSLGVPV